jgi:hypothetical protein
LDALYERFVVDFVQSKPCFRKHQLSLKRHPLSEGREATFWHMIAEGRDESNRTLDSDRCERISWVRAVIENANDPRVLVWENTRGKERRICLWLEEQEYVVILADRRGYLLPWTAYTVTQPHRKRKFRKEYEQWVRPQAGKS